MERIVGGRERKGEERLAHLSRPVRNTRFALAHLFQDRKLLLASRTAQRVEPTRRVVEQLGGRLVLDQPALVEQEDLVKVDDGATARVAERSRQYPALRSAQRTHGGHEPTHSLCAMTSRVESENSLRIVAVILRKYTR